MGPCTGSSAGCCWGRSGSTRALPQLPLHTSRTVTGSWSTLAPPCQHTDQLRPAYHNVHSFSSYNQLKLKKVQLIKKLMIYNYTTPVGVVFRGEGGLREEQGCWLSWACFFYLKYFILWTEFFSFYFIHYKLFLLMLLDCINAHNQTLVLSK